MSTFMPDPEPVDPWDQPLCLLGRPCYPVMPRPIRDPALDPVADEPVIDGGPSTAQVIADLEAAIARSRAARGA